ncbi:hypothetical protein MTO96_026560 [Rhipicephalus appendiculatus]
MQHNAATCHDQSTSCEVGLSKSTQAEIPTRSVSRRIQTMPLAPRNSRGAGCAVQGHAKVVDATEGDRRTTMAADTSCNVHRGNPSSWNVCFVVSAYGCGICSRSFEEVDALFSHVLACPWPEPFQCGLCSEPCASWGVTRDHLAAHIKRGTEKCPLCGHTFGKQWTVLRHIQRHHVPVRPFVCNCCGGAFFGKTDIYQHSRLCRARTQEVEKYLGSSEKCDSQGGSHLATTVYKCSVCPSAFLDRLVIARHMRAHLNKVQQSREGEELKKRPIVFGNDKSCAAKPVKVKRRVEAFAQPICVPSTVSSRTQCSDTEDSEDTS